MYVVINLIEKSNCTESSQIALNDSRPCAPNGLNRYNTNVVFDRNGVVISRYRKVNLFGEDGINTTLSADVSIFETDFNVKFGHFICFDLMFKTPALDIIEQNITDIIFPTMWFSELPFLTAVQIQQNWAYKFNVNFLAAGASNPKIGSTGSGIYAGNSGELVSIMEFTPTRKLLRSTVLRKDVDGGKVEPQESSDSNSFKMMDLYLKRDQLDVYSTIVLDSNLNNTETELCNNGLCCNFTISYQQPEVVNSSTYEYRLGVFNGVRTFDGFATGGIHTCSIIACSNSTISGCGVRFANQTEDSSQIKFNNISISGSFPTENSFTMPNAVNNLIMPISLEHFSYVEGSPYTVNDLTYIDVKYDLIVAHSDLLSFGIYGRVFDKDGMDVTGKGNLIGGSLTLILSIVAITTVFFAY